MQDTLSRRLILVLVCLWLVIGITDVLSFLLPGVLGPTPGPIRVLVVYDTAEQPINSTEIIHYWSTHCIKVDKTPEWRQWNKDTDAANETAEWRKLFALPRDKLPWVVIENEHGQRFSGPLPESNADRLALFKKWGGE